MALWAQVRLGNDVVRVDGSTAVVAGVSAVGAAVAAGDRNGFQAPSAARAVTQVAPAAAALIAHVSVAVLAVVQVVAVHEPVAVAAAEAVPLLDRDVSGVGV